MDMNDFLNKFYLDLEKETNPTFSSKIKKLIDENNFSEEEIVKVIKEEF